MIPVPTGVRVWLATGHTDMRRGFPGLSLKVQEVLRQNPLSGHLFVFRGRRGDLLKIIWHDGRRRRRLFLPRKRRCRSIAGSMSIYEAFGTRPFFVAEPRRRRDLDIARSARLSALRDRLASSPENVAADLGWLTV